ncbi:TniQ family protein [Burkholderia sp. A9]|uniref:TniQ family protein n=1 Tax=Burkholderia sp. A9 TaxID=1365108 RepID=UPI0012699AA7|nr:TniQ family protein [Burkholderia sp. A9]
MAVYLDEQLSDEPLFGIVARYIERTRSLSAKKVIRNVFGRVTVATSMPRGLLYIADQTQRCWGLSEKEIAEQMTCWPYFSALLSPKRSAKIFEQMTELSVQDIGSYQRGPAVRNGWYGHRLCQKCMREDRESGVSIHWRRAHQLPGVFICPWHGELLWYLDKMEACNYGYFSPETAIKLGARPIALRLARGQRKGCCEFARVSVDLLNGRFSMNFENLRTLFKNVICRRSFLVRNCCDVNNERMERLILDCFGGDFVSMVIPKWRGDNLRSRNRMHVQSALQYVVVATIFRMISNGDLRIDGSDFSGLFEEKSFGDIENTFIVPRSLLFCPSKVAAHGPGHMVEHTARTLGKLAAACSCGMRFILKWAGRWKFVRVTRWGVEDRREVLRLRSLGMRAPVIARQLGMPIRTVYREVAGRE